MTGSGRVVAPPPPPLPSRSASVSLESPFEEEEELSEIEEFPFTPGSPATPLPAAQSSPPRGTPPRGSPYTSSYSREPSLPPPGGRDRVPTPHREPHLPPPIGRESSRPTHTHEPALPAPHNGFAAPPLAGVPTPIARRADSAHFPFRPVLPRSGPPRAVIAAVLLAAVAGGAKLAAIATHGDRTRLVQTAEVTSSTEERAKPPTPP